MSGYSASRTRDQMARFYAQLLDRVQTTSRRAFRRLFELHPHQRQGNRRQRSRRRLHTAARRSGQRALRRRLAGIFPDHGNSVARRPRFHGRRRPSRFASRISRRLSAIINQTMAHRFFAHNSPIGKHFHFVEGNRPPLEIVGVVADSKYIDLREGPPTSSTFPERTETWKFAPAAPQKP